MLDLIYKKKKKIKLLKKTKKKNIFSLVKKHKQSNQLKAYLLKIF